MAKQSRKDKEIIQRVEEVKASLEIESMSKIFNLNNNQTFSKEEKPKNDKGLSLWGSKH